MNIGVLGLSGAGKTTYYLIWAGMLMNPGSFKIKDPLGSDIIYDISLDLSRIPLVAKGTFYSDIDRMLSGECVTATSISEKVTKIVLPIDIPFKGERYSIDLIFNDVSGEIFQALEPVLLQLKSGDPLERMKELVMNEIDKLISSRPDKRSKIGFQTLKEFLDSRFDGMILMMEPERTSAKNQVQLYYLIKILSENISKRDKQKYIVLYPKAAYYGIIDPDKVKEMDQATLKEYYDAIEKEALKALRKHGIIYNLMLGRSYRKLKERIEFVGAYYYDAFLYSEEKIMKIKDEFEEKEYEIKCIAPKLMEEDGQKYIIPFAPVYPLMRLIESIIENK